MKPSPAQAFGAQVRAQSLRVPPHDEGAERAVLGAILLGGKAAFDRAREQLSGSDFYASAHQLLWDVLEGLDRDGTALDHVTIRDAVCRNGVEAKIGGEAYLAELARDVPSDSAIADYASIVKDHSLARYAISACTTLIGLAYDPATLSRLPSAVSEHIEQLRVGLADAPGKDFDLDVVAPTLPALLAETDPPQSWLVDELLEEACGMLLYGPSYVGKSLNGWYAALCIARGYGNVFNRGIDAPPSNVVVFYGESSRRQVKNACRKFLAGEAGAPDTLRFVDAHAVTPFPNLATTEGRAWYEKVLVDAGARLAVFDTSTSLVVGNRNDSELASEVMAWMIQLGKKHGIARILIHHVRKGSTRGDDGSDADRAYGAGEWYNFSDTCVLLAEEGEDTIRVNPRKIRDHGRGQPFLARLDPKTLRFEFVADVGPEARKRGDQQGGPEPAVTPYQLLELIRDFGTLTSKELRERLGVSKITIQRRTTSAEFSGWLQQGIVVRTEGGGRTPESFRFVGPMP